MNKNQDKKIKNNLINILNNIFSNDKIKKENEIFYHNYYKSKYLNQKEYDDDLVKALLYFLLLKIILFLSIFNYCF